MALTWTVVGVLKYAEERNHGDSPPLLYNVALNLTLDLTKSNKFPIPSSKKNKPQEKDTPQLSPAKSSSGASDHLKSWRRAENNGSPLVAQKVVVGGFGVPTPSACALQFFTTCRRSQVQKLMLLMSWCWLGRDTTIVGRTTPIVSKCYYISLLGVVVPARPFSRGVADGAAGNRGAEWEINPV
jgi:hypothetical protein